jgi:hypothetical protein
MAIVAARLTSTGTLFISGEFDEVTTSTIRVNTTTQYAKLFDEVTYSSTIPAFKNLLSYTEQFENAYWIKTNGSISADVTVSPIGNSTADKFVEASTSTNKEFQRGSLTVVSGTSYTISVYAKAAERTAFRFGATTAYFPSATNSFFELSNGTIPVANQGGFTASTITLVGNGWYRCTATFVPTVSGSGLVLYHTLMSASTSGYLGDGTSGMYFWGSQLEVGTTATIYQGVGATNTLVPISFIKREDNTGAIFVTDSFNEVDKPT